MIRAWCVECSRQTVCEGEEERKRAAIRQLVDHCRAAGGGPHGDKARRHNTLSEVLTGHSARNESGANHPVSIVLFKRVSNKR